MRKIAILLLLLAGTASLYADDGLYAPSVPEDAALVRVVNATDATITFDVGPLRFRNVAAASATPYRSVQPGIFMLQYAGAREMLTPKAKSFLSVILSGGGITIIEDVRHTDPARAQIVVYNLTDRPVDLKAIDQGATLVAAVPPLSAGIRAVNAISVRVGAFDGEKQLLVAALDLARGASYTIVVRDGDPPGFVVQASVATE